jgi:hypothetical protein
MPRKRAVVVGSEMGWSVTQQKCKKTGLTLPVERVVEQASHRPEESSKYGAVRSKPLPLLRRHSFHGGGEKLCESRSDTGALGHLFGQVFIEIRHHQYALRVAARGSESPATPAPALR